MQSITVGNRQTLLDMAMQHAGSSEAAFAMCVQNDVPITKVYAAGTILPAPVIINEDVVTLYLTEKAKPASIISSPETDNIFEGIGYWYIEDDFIVQ